MTGLFCGFRWGHDGWVWLPRLKKVWRGAALQKVTPEARLCVNGSRASADLLQAPGFLRRTDPVRLQTAA